MLSDEIKKFMEAHAHAADCIRDAICCIQPLCPLDEVPNELENAWASLNSALNALGEPALNTERECELWRSAGGH